MRARTQITKLSSLPCEVIPDWIPQKSAPIFPFVTMTSTMQTSTCLSYHMYVFFFFLLFYFTTYIHYVSNRDGMFMQTPFRNNPRGISHLPTSNLTSWRISPLKKPNPTLSTTTRRAQSVT